MSKHTQEPWKINTDEAHDGWSIITNKSGSIIANVNGKTGPELIGGMPVDRVMPAEDNARRIVACVNACSGIRTEALEHRAHMLNAHDDTISELTRQRDELLEALEEVTEYAEMAMEQANKAGSEWEIGYALYEAKIAIAKAKGGAE